MTNKLIEASKRKTVNIIAFSVITLAPLLTRTMEQPETGDECASTSVPLVGFSTVEHSSFQAPYPSELERLQKAVSNGTDVLTRSGDEGWCPIHIAAQLGYIPFLMSLVHHGAKVNTLSSSGKEPIHCAAAQGHIPVIKWLIEQGVSISVEDARGITALHIAAAQGQLPTVEWLIDNGASVNTPSSSDGCTPLHYAANEQIAQYLCEKGASVISKAENGATPLHYAANEGHIDLMHWLIQTGASIIVQDNDGFQPIHYAAASGRLDTVQWLIKHGASIHAQAYAGTSPLDEALGESFHADGDLTLIIWLIGHGARTDLAVLKEKIPLLARKFKQSYLIRCLDENTLDTIQSFENDDQEDISQLLTLVVFLKHDCLACLLELCQRTTLLSALETAAATNNLAAFKLLYERLNALSTVTVQEVDPYLYWAAVARDESIVDHIIQTLEPAHRTNLIRSSAYEYIAYLLEHKEHLTGPEQEVLMSMQQTLVKAALEN